ncbi:sugar phosphate isomerase/epimerase [candidate division WOR-3 bacterium]|nr:sugar phosphate isomerase/epimerase [candidate division WOR-3 bacterium]
MSTNPMHKIYIQPFRKNFENYLDTAKKLKCNMEIASFAYADILDTNWQEVLEDYCQQLQGFDGIISTHGAFQGLIIHSRDKKISNVAKDRISHNLKIALALNAKYIVFHGNFNPLITLESYKKNWIEQNATFWSELLNRYRITVLLENVWEFTPDLFKTLIEKVNSPRLKICFDTGHWNVYSKVPLSEWFDVLGKDIPYMHINDNKGDVDSELAPGEGNIDWKGFSDLIREKGLTPDIVFEVGTLEKAMEAIDFFKKNKLYPFGKK